MSGIDYDIGKFLAKWTSQQQPKQFTAALKDLVEKVQAHGFKLGEKSAWATLRAALELAERKP